MPDRRGENLFRFTTHTGVDSSMMMALGVFRCTDHLWHYRCDSRTVTVHLMNWGMVAKGVLATVCASRPFGAWLGLKLKNKRPGITFF